MKKTVLYKGLLFIDLILIASATLLAVYTTKELIKLPEFKFDVFFGMLGSYCLVIALFAVSVILIIKMLGGNSNGKNS